MLPLVPAFGVTVSGGIPVPFKETDRDIVFGLLNGIDISAFTLPDDVGENTTLKVQLPDGAMLVPEQLSVLTLNCETLLPVNPIAATTIASVPVLLSVMVVDELAPMPTFPKSNEDGLIVAL